MTKASVVIAALRAAADPADVEYVVRFYKGGDRDTDVLGVRMPKVFPITKRFSTLPLSEIALLLDDTRYEVRMAAVAIMDFQARQKGLDPEHRKALYDLYLARHDRLNNWDLVDRAAPHVVGEYLWDKDRSVLDRLAHSENPNEQRTALVATHAFIKRGETDDTFRIAGILADDSDAFVQKAIGSWVREAGKKDEAALTSFLFAHKACLPRSTIKAAVKLLPGEVTERLLRL